jgi:hypothetical protein
MNEVMQAVNELRGDLRNTFWFEGSEGLLYLSRKETYIAFITDCHGDRYQYICTVEEFNSLVAELSAAEWIKER